MSFILNFRALFFFGLIVFVKKKKKKFPSSIFLDVLKKIKLKIKIDKQKYIHTNTHTQSQDFRIINNRDMI